MLVVRPAENALLRRFGKSETAMVRAVEGVNERDDRVGVYRVKLEVDPPGGEPFVAVAEDAIRMGPYGAEWGYRVASAFLKSAWIYRQDSFGVLCKNLARLAVRF